MNRRSFLKGFVATAVVASYELSPVKLIELPIKDAKFLTVDQVIATTLSNYREVIAKNITSQQSVFMALKRQGFING